MQVSHQTDHITQVVIAKAKAKMQAKKKVKSISLKSGEALSEQTEAPKIEPLAVSKKVKTVKETLSRKERAKKLYDMWLAAQNAESVAYLGEELKALKKATKVSWETLGLPKDFTLN